MSYTPTLWVDGETPVNATNMNKIEQGIANNSNAIDALRNNGTGGTGDVANFVLAGSVVTTETVSLISIPMGEHVFSHTGNELLVTLNIPKNESATKGGHVQLYFNNEASVTPVIRVFTCQSEAFGMTPHGYNTQAVYWTRIIDNMMYTARYMNNYGSQGYPQETFTTTSEISNYPFDSTRWAWLNVRAANTAEYPHFPIGTEVKVYVK